MSLSYRVYCFDGASRILSADWIQATNDAAALADAKRNMNCPRIEVWQRDRLVARYERPTPNGSNAEPSPMRLRQRS